MRKVIAAGAARTASVAEAGLLVVDYNSQNSITHMNYITAFWQLGNLYNPLMRIVFTLAFVTSQAFRKRSLKN